jgi:SAM-dependent methyltransferase
MSFAHRILMRMFGRPEGVLGRLGGIILARANRSFADEIVALLEVGASEKVLEVGFGPGVGIELLARAAPRGTIAGVDPSEEMVEQAKARNAASIGTGVVDLRRGTVADSPSKKIPSTRRLRSTPCRCGRTPRQDCARSGAGWPRAAGWPSASRPTRGSRGTG